ncbi:hypothetical protein E2C01_049979 [Portunus trituberculatus]|uniref:Uncharacterized protein n=1 Tax=Portunus trituberculatus TaxID=210409 RepID=A0A5B7GEV4_PORTR|nr:hypothetical protein [Portunus trituberculatus]
MKKNFREVSRHLGLLSREEFNLGTFLLPFLRF